MELDLSKNPPVYRRADGQGGDKTLMNLEDAQTVVGIKTFPSGTVLASPTITTPTLTSPTITTPLGVVVALEALFTQVAGNKTHTAAFSIPAGATILDVIITATAVWDSDTSATLIAGINGGDNDCFFTALDVKSVPAAGKSINFAHPGNASGASVPEIDAAAGNTQLGATGGFLYNATAKTLDVIITDVNVSGAAGRTRVTVLYSLPSAVISPTVQ